MTVFLVMYGIITLVVAIDAIGDWVLQSQDFDVSLAKVFFWPFLLVKHVATGFWKLFIVKSLVVLSLTGCLDTSRAAFYDDTVCLRSFRGTCGYELWECRNGATYVCAHGVKFQEIEPLIGTEGFKD